MREEGVVISFEVLTWCLLVGTKENLNFENNDFQIKMQNEYLLNVKQKC
jgi:hypothetical protein